MANDFDGLTDRICPVCGHAFCTHGASWGYVVKYSGRHSKRSDNPTLTYVCSYHCYRKLQKEKEAVKKNVKACKLSDEELHLLLDMINAGESRASCGKRFGIAPATVTYYVDHYALFEGIGDRM